jgi:carboxypeptidase C (cathepsin A)
MRGCLSTLSALLISVPAFASESSSGGDQVSKGASEAPQLKRFVPEQQASKGTITIAGKRLDYNAYAGTLVVHLKDWDDVRQNANKEDKMGPAEASMFYVAYSRSGTQDANRPITFLFNGGPGSSTVWLHMGAFGPRRVVTADNTHSPPAPYPETRTLELSKIHLWRELRNHPRGCARQSSGNPAPH